MGSAGEFARFAFFKAAVFAMFKGGFALFERLDLFFLFGFFGGMRGFFKAAFGFDFMDFLFAAFLFGDRKTERADLTAQSVIAAVAERDQPAFFQRQFARFVQQGIVHVDRQNFSHEHIVRPQFFDFGHFAFDADGALRDLRRFDEFAGHRSQSRFGEFVRVASRLDAAEIGGVQQILRGQVDDKFPVLFNQFVGIARRANRNVRHCGFGIDNARPRGGEHIGLFHRSRRYHHGGQRINHRSRFPSCFGH